ncbi:MAG: alpha/beta fold hydrolase [Pseudomonadota bacterium]
MNYTTQAFDPAPWCTNRHWQTVFPSTPLYRSPDVAYEREALELPDGDFVDIDWAGRTGRPDQTLLIVLPGLEGNSEASYALTIGAAAVGAGWALGVMHYRGCSGRPNRLPRRYHAGDTGDIDFLAGLLREQHPNATLLGVGYSLGGNVLLKYLGERGDSAVFDGSVAVCVPFDLADSALALSSGPSRFYQSFLMRRMRASLRVKYRPEYAPFDWDRAMQAKTFYEFDDQVTAPLHGFRGVDDYYSRSSCGQFIGSIRKPTLLISALDDPFMTGAAFPATADLPADVRAEFSRYGGHVGFVNGRPWLRPEYWLHARTMGFYVHELGVAANSDTQTSAKAIATSDAGGR